MNKTKIEWCDYTWNPVTGCKHGCTYCYAERISKRFTGNFDPTFHENRLPEPAKLKNPSRIFVVSMGDLFGEWVPEEWIEKVFDACEKAPQHTYLFLTKNASKYTEIINKGIIRPRDNYWFGTTVTSKNGDAHRKGQGINTFVSIEPLLEDIGHGDTTQFPDWVIVGAQTGPKAIKPKPEWVQTIIEDCRTAGVPIFLKNNLNWPEKIQEVPNA